jgi:CRISPR/Cas system-associated exonuclease Cas4 (RecB family)
MRRTSRPHWSYSAVNQYLRCPLQYYFERVLKLPRTTVNSGLVFGSVVHDTLAVFHLGLQRKEAISRNELQKTFVAGWNTRVDEEIITFKPTESADDLLEKGLSLIELYVQEPPTERIVSVEQSAIVPLRNSKGEYLEKPLVAIADLVTREDGTLKINEFKTSARAYSKFEVESSLQATCYANAMLESYGEEAKIQFTVFVKTKTPKIQKLQTTRTDSDLGRLGDLVETIDLAAQNETFYPVENCLNCSGCSFRQQCREWKPTSRDKDDHAALVTLKSSASC